MKILISGASGLVGQALVNFLSLNQHEVFKLVRKRTDLKKDEIRWDIKSKKIDLSALEGFDAVIHLAGENIAGKWTAEKKKKIENSRVASTEFLCETLKKLNLPPRVLISASAIGYYGSQEDKVLNEQAPQGKGFLADVCEKWEKPTQTLKDKGIRVVNMRIGMVLSSKGGALKTMLTPFKFCVGGKIGSGRQYISWIAIDDLVAIFNYALHHDTIVGPINAVSPYPVTNDEFTKTLGSVIKRPTFLSVPEIVVEKLFGEMGEAVLLASQRVRPQVLLLHKFQFTHPVLGEALEHLLN